MRSNLSAAAGSADCYCYYSKLLLEEEEEVLALVLLLVEVLKRSRAQMECWQDSVDIRGQAPGLVRS